VVQVEQEVVLSRVPWQKGQLEQPMGLLEEVEGVVQSELEGQLEVLLEVLSRVPWQQG